jgi:hypothetical protein
LYSAANWARPPRARRTFGMHVHALLTLEISTARHQGPTMIPEQTKAPTTCRLKALVFFFLSAALVLAEEDFETANGRAKYAGFLMFHVTALDDHLPSLTPDEVDWLEKERATIARISDPETRIKRQIAFSRSKEFSIEFLKAKCATAREALTRITNKGGIPLRAEVWYWMLYIEAFLARSTFVDTIGNLRNQGVLDAKDIDPEAFANVQIYYCREILQKIVMPNYVVLGGQ